MNKKARGRQWPLLAHGMGAMAALALTACGGGSSPEAPATPAAEAPASAYRVATLAHDGSAPRWVVADPLAVDKPVEVPLSTGEVSSARSSAVRVDTSAGTTTQLGDRLLVYLDGGKLYRMDLLGTANPAPARVSAAERLCQISTLVPLQADGSLAAVAVSQRPATAADCSGPLETVLLRTDAAADTAGINLGAGRLLGGLPAADGSMAALLLSTPGTGNAGEALQVRSTALATLPDPVLATPPAGSTAAFLGVDPSTAGLGYVALGRQALALRWSGSSVSVESTALVSLEATDLSTQVATQGATDGLYMVDKGAVYRLARAKATLLGRVEARNAVFDLPRGFRGLHLTATHVLVDTLALRPESGGGAVNTLYEVHALPRTGGVPQVLASAVSGDFRPSVITLTALGATESRMLVSQRTCGSLGCFDQLLTLDPQAGTTTEGPSVAGVLRAATAPTGTPGYVTRRLVYGGSSAVDMQEQNAADGGSPVNLGVTGQQWPTALLQGHEGLPLGFGGQTLPVDAAGRTDAWLLRPGVAASLQRLTRYLP